MPIDRSEPSDPSEEAVTYSPSKVSWGMAEFVAAKPSAAVSYAVRLLLLLLGLTMIYAAFFEAPHTIAVSGVLERGGEGHPRLIARVRVGVSESLLIKKGMKVTLRVDGVSERAIPPFDGVVESVGNEPAGSPPSYAATVSGEFSGDANVLSADPVLRPGMPVNALVVLGRRTPLARVLQQWFNLGAPADRS